jgi:hypothetical protein
MYHNLPIEIADRNSRERARRGRRRCEIDEQTAQITDATDHRSVEFWRRLEAEQTA